MHRLKQAFKHRRTPLVELVTAIQTNAGAVSELSTAPAAVRRGPHNVESKSSRNRIGLHCEPIYQCEERARLTEEQQIIRKRLDRRHRAAIAGRRRSNHRAFWKVLADEITRLGQDQISLVQFRVERVQIGERQVGYWIRDEGERLGNCVTSFVVPQSEVIDLNSADADENP